MFIITRKRVECTLILMLLIFSVEHSATVFIRVFHYISPQWESESKSHESFVHTCTFPGKKTIFCEWIDHGNQTYLKRLWKETVKSTITVALYNIHTLWESDHVLYPTNCEWPTNLTMVSSEESHKRCSRLFNASFGNFDGNSTTHSSSTVQRIYDSAYLHGFHVNDTHYRPKFQAASFIATSCHDESLPNVAPREKIVLQLRRAGIRVDGLGKCAKSAALPGVFLPQKNLNNPTINTENKRRIEGQYMFNLAFENSLEEGYVIEKPFESLLAGSVPVYLGDAVHLKRLLPHPKAAVFVDDFGGNISTLAKYLGYLMTNDSAYQEHRSWRKTFLLTNYVTKHPILSISWYCGVCRWASTAVPKNAGSSNLSNCKP